MVERHQVRTVRDFDDFTRKVQRSLESSEFVWRGVHDASFAMHSSLYRHTSRRLGHHANERELLTAERAIFDEAANTWGLRDGGALQLLAELQHTGTPTRLLDFSTDPLVALWFAVEQRREPAARRLQIDRVDGRVFAVQVGTEVSAHWARSIAPPWWPESDGGRGTPKDWQKTVYVWRPSASIRRIENQSGVLLVGGVPSTDTPLLTEVGGVKQLLTRDEIRACTSLAVRINKASRLEGEGRGRPAKAPLAFTCRIPAGRKRAIREELEKRDPAKFKHSFMYQDHAGFAAFSSAIPETG
jgi:FRG domain